MIKSRGETNKAEIVSYGPVILGTPEVETCEYCVIMGLNGDKNRINDNRKLKLEGMKELVVTDLDYFIEHHEEILEAVKYIRELRDQEIGVEP